MNLPNRPCWFVDQTLLNRGKAVRAILCFAVLLVVSACDSLANPYAPIEPFLQRYCVECHGETKQKGEVRLDQFDSIDGTLWVDIYDQVYHGDMPPEDEPQPTEQELAEISKLIDQISRDDSFSISTGYRRLNRREYANTVRELLGLKPGLYDPAANIFQDEIEHGFDTNAEELVISNELLLEYLESAERSLRIALFLENLEQPETKVKNFAPGKLDGGDRRYTTNKKKSTVLRGRGEYVAQKKACRVEVAGNYRVTITAAGVDRDNYGRLKFAPETGPIKMGVGAALENSGKQISTLEETFEIKDGEFESYETVMWLEKGAYPWVSFLNGSKKPAASIRQAVRRRQLKPANNPKSYRGPGVEVTQFKVEGPLDPEWPPATYRKIFRMDTIPDFENEEVRNTILSRFVSRSLRRVATEADVQDYRDYLAVQYGKYGDWHEAFIKTFAAIMASHDFLYLKESVGELKPFELVSRLSYFLWSSMPDLELLTLAHSGEIRKPEVYGAQVDRLLNDPRIEEFVRGFAIQWLSLDLLGTMSPDIKDSQYGVYHKRGYETAFREETLTYFRYVLFRNQPVGDFLDSDYTFLNKPLAEAYELPFTGNSDFQRVTLPEGSVRGGLLGHGSILSLTSNGVETLPVTRGHWVLDELLGTPPPPAPAAVPALVPDLTGTDTPRAQLVRHREDAACFDCHKQMDPIGLALENFDVIGRYREKYKPGPMIDPSGEMFGQSFKNVAELRKILRTREGDFAKSLTIKLAEYAKGRELNRSDLEIVDQVVAEAAKEEFRFKSLLRRLLMSRLILDR